MIWLDWLLVLLVCVGIPAGILFGRRLEREHTRMRGEAALLTFRDVVTRDPWAGINPEPFERLLRNATGLDDLEPPNDRTDA